MSIWLAHSATRRPNGKSRSGADNPVDFREEDFGVEPCDGCGSIDLQTLVAGRTYVEYLCRRCRYRLIRQINR
jgi:hypothetical protein